MGRYYVARPGQIAGDTRVVRDGEHLFSYVAPLIDTTIGDALTERLADLPPLLPAVAQPAQVTAKARKPRLDASNPRVAGMLAIYEAAKQVIRLDVQELDATVARVAMRQGRLLIVEAPATL